MASSPSSSGIRMSISTTSGRVRRTAVDRLGAVGRLGDDVDPSAVRIIRKPVAHQRLVVGDHDPHAAAHHPPRSLAQPA